jgi:hypothetical protein
VLWKFSCGVYREPVLPKEVMMKMLKLKDSLYGYYLSAIVSMYETVA